MPDRRGKVAVRIATIACAVAVSVSAQDSGVNLDVALLAGAAPAGFVEITGVEAGEFNPALWQTAQFNLVPDHRFPLVSPLNGTWRNIYAPSAVETPGGYRLFYGAWDGIPEGKDRIYSGDADFEFLNVTNRHTVVLPGTYQHVCNVNAIRLEDGSFRFVATVFPTNNLNKPAWFRSDTTGTNWNGAAGEPYTVRPHDFLRITGYTNASGGDAFPAADINGVNVVLHENGLFRFYFGDFKDIPNGGLQVYRASSQDGTNYTFEGRVLQGNNAVNDVKKFRVGTNDWYLPGSHLNGDRLWYSISTNPLSFPPVNTLLWYSNATDRYIVALGWVVKGEQEQPGRKLLGVLYGAGPVPSLDQNKIFARWLQKKVVFVAADGTRYPGNHAFGPNRQLFSLPGTNALSGSFELYDEDGVTFLGRSLPFGISNGQRLQVRRLETDPLPGLFNTGEDGEGNLLAPGAVDPHFQLVSSADPAYPGPAAYVVNEPLPSSVWSTNGPDSKWIAPRVNATNSPGVYVYRTALLLTNIDPRTVTISGRWASDNAGTNIVINGATNLVTSTVRNAWRTFSVTRGLRTGTNEIDFVHRNTGTSPNATGVRIEVAAAAPAPGRFTPPLTIPQPQDASGRQGTNLVLTSAAIGSLPLEFQWEHNEMPLPGETNGSLTLSNAQPSQSGRYRARIRNLAGEVTTQEAVIEIVPPPPPRFQGVTTAQNTNLLLAVSGEAGDRYRLQASSNLISWSWLRDVTNVNGTVVLMLPIDARATFYRLEAEQ